MKKLILHRWIPMLLSMMLILSLAACGGEKTQSRSEDKSGTTKVFSVNKTKEKETPAEDQEEDSCASVQEGIDMLQTCMKSDEVTVAAVAYLGYRDQSDSTPLGEWLRKSSPGLIDAMPFIAEIPEERILGAGYGELYCIVPRDENTTLTVTRLKWEPRDGELWPVIDKDLYNAKDGQPVLVYVGFHEERYMYDTKLYFETDEGMQLDWSPMVDEDAILIVPHGENGIPMIMDFEIFGVVTGLDYPEEWGIEASESWLPPTDRQLADSTWICEGWYIELLWGDCDPEYSGLVNLHYQSGDSEYEPAYSGVWRMEDDRLRMEISAGVGTSAGGAFPVKISPMEESLLIQADPDTYVSPPFFGYEDIGSMELTRTYMW